MMTDISNTMGMAPRKASASAFRASMPCNAIAEDASPSLRAGQAAEFLLTPQANESAGENGVFSELSAIRRRPDELRIFMESLPRANAAPGSSVSLRFRKALALPTWTEILVAGGVMLATAALTLWAILAVAG
jgi:hypothetical protein